MVCLYSSMVVVGAPMRRTRVSGGCSRRRGSSECGLVEMRSELAELYVRCNMSNQPTCLIREVNGDDAPTCSNEQRGAELWTEYEAADRAWERQHAAEWERVDQKL